MTGSTMAGGEGMAIVTIWEILIGMVVMVTAVVLAVAKRQMILTTVETP